MHHYCLRHCCAFLAPKLVKAQGKYLHQARIKPDILSLKKQKFHIPVAGSLLQSVEAIFFAYYFGNDFLVGKSKITMHLCLPFCDIISMKQNILLDC